ncbi:MAG TPA: hypothetical protein VGF45_16745, partial [Polyangia bacterium]
MSLGIALASCGHSDPEEPQARADRWADEHKSGWELTVDERDPQRALAFASSGSCPTTSGFTTVKYTAPGYAVALGFRCLSKRPTTLESLREAFGYAVLEELPHGIEVPGWKFEVSTPSSSVKEGVTFTSFAEGRLSLRIVTPLLSVRGTSEDRDACPLIADAALPPQCFVDRRLGIPLTLTMTMPFTQPLFEQYCPAGLPTGELSPHHPRASGAHTKTASPR